jgi:hypothetical protein
LGLKSSDTVDGCKPVLVGCSPGGTSFTMTGELAGVSKFWGKYVEVLVQGVGLLYKFNFVNPKL